MSKSKKIALVSPTLVKKIVTFYFYFYLILSALTLIATIAAFLEKDLTFVYVLPSIIAALIAYGIYNKFSWIPFVIILFAIIGLISNFFSSTHGLFWVLSMFFLILEIFFFSNKEIKKYFSNKNN